MKPEEFETILGERLEKIKKVLSGKAKEYASNSDRLHNFKIAARIDAETPAKALWGMAKKHLVCVVDMVNGDLDPTPVMVDEKIGDMINYLILLEAIFLEES